MSRITTRIFLGFALILAIGVAFYSLFSIESSTDVAWATLAAALAVVTSMVSAFSSQRVVELEEDRLRPYPYPYFDTTSRYGLLLFRVKNNGGGSAHNISLLWDSPLIDSKGELVSFSQEKMPYEIPVLFQGQSLARIVDGYTQFFKMDKKHRYSGIIEFSDSAGKQYSNKFILDAEMLRGLPYHDMEELKTNHELQKLPDEIKKIRVELSKIEKSIVKHSAEENEL